MNRLPMAAVFGVIAGLVGALAWAAVSYFLHFETGWLAWGIGVLVGIAVAMGAQEESGYSSGILAVAIAVLAIVGGKWLSIEVEAHKIIKEATGEVYFTDHDCIVAIADETYAEWTASGRDVTFPPGQSVDTAYYEDDYPRELWQEASSLWEVMPIGQRDDFREEQKDVAVSRMKEGMQDVKMDALKASFSPFDILFFGLAIFSAFKLGARVVSND